MKKTLILLSILTSFVASAQSIEINPNGGTNASAILDLKSTTKGFLLPRMTNAQMRAISSPAQGLLAFCTDCGTNGDYYFYKGTDWVTLGSTTVSVSTTVGSVSANADEKGATITNGVLNLAPANATNPGIVTKTDQTFGGVKTFSNGIVGNVTGNAATVTTNANLTGVVTSTGNATSIADRAISNAMLFNGAVANLSGTNTGDNAVNSLYSGLLTNATHTGDVTGSTALTIADNAITTAKIATGAITDSKVTDVAASKITGTLPVSKGGTGSDTQNFVDLTSEQTIFGRKTFETSLVLKMATPSRALFADANRNLVSNEITGTGNVVMSTSPALAGTPTAPTPTASTNNTQIATTEFVKAGFVPYTGATGAVNLGAYDLTVNGLNVGKGRSGITTNTAIGVSALASNTTGSNNTANGLSALTSNTTGSGNTANGVNALQTNISGNNNTANGVNALQANVIGVQNTANGVNALSTNTASFNTANGANALNSNTTGNNNTANGRSALTSNTTGENNTATGFYALQKNITGSNNTAIGKYADVASDNLTNATAIGHEATVDASHKIQIGNGEVTAVQLGTDKVILETSRVKLTGGTPGAGKVLTSDADGLASWATASGVDLTTAQTIAGAKTFSVAPVLSSTTASKAVFTDANKNIVSNEITGTGNVVMSNAPAFTGTVSGITKSMIDLANVDNTSDANKPVSTATSTALANKVDKVAGERLINAAEITKLGNQSGTNTGDQTLPTLSSLGALSSNTAITGATNTKITYDSKGLVTAGATATTADIAESTDKKYVTDAQLTKINNTLGNNTGDNAVNSLYSGLVSNATHTGDVTGATALTIANDAVTAAKIAAGAITDSKVTDVAASKITGTLPVSKGGTGTTTLTANSVLLGNGTSTLQAIAPGENGNVLTSNGITWSSVAATVSEGSTSGDLMYWNLTDKKWAILAPGTEG